MSSNTSILSLLKPTLIVVFMIFLIQSCRLGEPYERQDDISLETFRFNRADSANIADMPWWELFKDTVLTGLIETALLNNPDLSVAAARIEESTAQLGIVRSNLYPRVDYSGGTSLDFNSESNNVSGNGTAAAAVSYQVDLWGRFRNLNDAAFQEYLATEEGYRNAVLTIVSSVADAYLVLRDIDNRLSVSERTAISWKENLDIINARYTAGLVSEVNVKQAEIQWQEAQASIQVFLRLRGQTENGISTLLGLPPQNIPRGQLLQDQIFPPVMPVGVPSELLVRRPDVLAAERQLEAQNFRIGAAEALRYPSLTLSADIGAFIADPTSLFTGLSAQILGPITNAKANIRRQEVEEARARQLLGVYQSTYLTALREVEDAMIAVETYTQEFVVRQAQVTSATEALKLSWVRYDSGITSYLEIIDLQRSEFSAYLKASETLQLKLNSMIDLYRALGGGWQVEPDIQ